MIELLSESRWLSLLDRCAEDTQRALLLMEWSAQVNAAITHDLEYLEVALRNAYDRALRMFEPSEWVYAPEQVFPDLPHQSFRLHALHAKLCHKIEHAIESLREEGKAPTIDQVVSRLSFGFWVTMSDTRLDVDGWRKKLRHAWPAGTNRRHVHACLLRLLVARNRTAHHETVNHMQLRQTILDIFEVSKQLHPDVFTLIRATTNLPYLLRVCPEREVQVNS